MISRKILEEYNIDPESLPPVQVIPRGVSGIQEPPEGQGMHWKEAREKQRRIYNRNEKFRRADAGYRALPKVKPAPANVDQPVVEKAKKPGRKPKAPKEPKVPKVPEKVAAKRERAGVLQQCVAEGMTTAQIAARLNMSQKTIRSNLRDLGIKAPKPPVTTKPPSRQRIDRAWLLEQIKDLIGKGMNAAMMAEHLGNVGSDTICSTAKQAGIKIPRVMRMPPKKPLDEATILAAWQSGIKNVRTIAKMVKSGEDRVKEFLLANGFERNHFTGEFEQKRKAVKAAHDRGLTLRGIMQETGFLRMAVIRALKSYGLEPRATKSPLLPPRESISDAAQRLHREGRSSAEIAALLNIPASRVIGLIKQRRDAE